jgi:hypothetical protein
MADVQDTAGERGAAGAVPVFEEADVGTVDGNGITLARAPSILQRCS